MHQWTRVLAAALCVAHASGCTVIGLTHKATQDGTSLLAHTDDAGGGTADTRLIRVPAADHAPGSKRAVYNFFGGYPRVTTHDRGQLYEPVGNQTLSEPLGYIPQVPHTYAYFDQDYGMMNEMQLSIAESTCTAKTVGWAKDVPYGYNLFGIAELTKVALERCDSARCAIKTMGDLAVEYGFFSEDSGDPRNPGYMDSAEALAISDKFGEMWVFHVMTGPKNASAVWAAQRVPDGHVTAIANAFTIREINFNDTENFMASSNVVSFAEEMGWHVPGTPFDFTKAYAWDDLTIMPGKILPLYAGRRLWRIFDTFAPSLKLDGRLGFQVNFTTYPFSVPVDSPANLTQLIALLGDHYEGTPYDMTKGVGAGPFEAPIRYDGPFFGVDGGWERPIAMFRTMFSFILQNQHPSSKLPSHLGGTAWYSQDSPHGSIYVPFSCAQDALPDSYVTGNQSVFNTNSAWWAFNFVNQWSMIRWNTINADVRSVMATTQARAIAEHSKWLNNKLNASQIQEAANALASDIVSQWWQFAWSLIGKYSCGYIVTGEGPSQMKVPGYSREWLVKTEFAGWPGASYADPNGPDHFARPLVDSHASKMNAVEIIGFMVLGALLAIGTHSVVQTRRREGAQMPSVVVAIACLWAAILAKAADVEPLFAVDHENVTYLTDDNFDATIREGNMPWMVNFYSPACWHCRSFAPIYEEIAAHYKMQEKRIRVGAISCLDHTLCRKMEINGYPHLVFFNFDPLHPGETKRRRGNAKKEAIYQFVTELQDQFSSVGIVNNEVIRAEDIPSPTIWTATPDTSTQLTRLRDAANAIIFGFKHELFASADTLSETQMDALKKWINTLSIAFPGSKYREALRNLFNEIAQMKELSADTWEDLLADWQDEGVDVYAHVPTEWSQQPTIFKGDGKEWQVCSGYTCGLWVLIHILAQQAPANANCVDIYKSIRGFFEHFMTCQPCQAHFLELNPAQLQTKTPVSLQIWAHDAHNKVDDRVGHPYFPSPRLCPRCDNDRGAALKFLKSHYGYGIEKTLLNSHKPRVHHIPWCLVVIGCVILALILRKRLYQANQLKPVEKDVDV